MNKNKNINALVINERTSPSSNSQTELLIPIQNKLLLSIREAAEYSNIGINKIDSLLRTPNCPFVLYVGSKKLVKRQKFEEFIQTQLII